MFLRPRFESDSSFVTILSGNEVLAEIIPTVINATDAALARFQPTDRNCYTDQVSIPPTFYEQLLHAQIPKVQKDSQVKQLFALLGPSSVKAACKQVGEIDSWVQLHQCSTSSFYAHRSQKRKKAA